MRRQKWYARREILATLILPSTILFAALMLLTIWSWRSAYYGLKEEQNRAVRDKVDTVEDTINRRLDTYEVILHSAAGLVKSNGDTVNRNQWNQFTDNFNLVSRYPGVLGLGYNKVIRADQLSNLTEQLNATDQPGFTIHPAGIRDYYAPVVYLEPQNEINSQAIGFDMFTDQTRRTTMEMARDSGRATITPKVQLIQDKTEAGKHSFIMFVPLYASTANTSTVQARRAAINGFVYAPFRASDFITSTFYGKNDPNAGFAIYSNSPQSQNLLYVNQRFNELKNQPEHLHISDQVNLNGTSWYIDFMLSKETVPSALRYRPATILYGGLLLSILLSILLFVLLRYRVYSLTREQDREIQLAKDDLLSLASHQLRTPATGVKQYMGMVLEGYAGELNTQQKEYLVKAYESNERQLHIINELLYVAKAEAGRIILAKRKLDVGKLIKEVIEELRSEIEDRQHTVKLTLPKKAVIINADEHCLRMAIENIINNATKYMSPGGKINVRVIRFKTEIEIRVRDYGVGIDPAETGLLFRQFTRIPNEHTRQTSGSGIGLYLARYLIQLHDGTITVKSRVGHGSTFTITLPVQ